MESTPLDFLLLGEWLDSIGQAVSETFIRSPHIFKKPTVERKTNLFVYLIILSLYFYHQNPGELH